MTNSLRSFPCWWASSRPQSLSPGGRIVSEFGHQSDGRYGSATPTSRCPLIPQEQVSVSAA